MFGKGTKLYSIFTSKCPKCHEGNLFLDTNPYHLKNMDKMCQNCPVCGEPSEPEPNFYYGAMYVSYAYTVALFVSIYILAALLGGMTMWPTIGLLILVLVALGPYIFRLSRITYLNFFVDYDKDAASKS
ncbi:MAG TPA: DUF983 domain-containing protein [Cryomorphaceae bacterium]|jgi:uncharacterized protein (DUF983 family)|nr:MAG: hypothetical protein ABR98_07260 [Cryomorphaceae bacterium BACL7 MAG-120910-bin2]KRO68899.1 MAG: hypothetical protein ABR88_01145 [Cryomorphaceae bacterium BACL7 MAG-120322-bin74]HAB31321.1 DUF983 domain-containing protein [Cryomorphaceae bacterium]HAG48676.1 DUF983 domain-containing protein [Cryomorphaceae bacterium]